MKRLLAVVVPLGLAVALLSSGCSSSSSRTVPAKAQPSVSVTTPSACGAQAQVLLDIAQYGGQVGYMVNHGTTVGNDGEWQFDRLEGGVLIVTSQQPPSDYRVDIQVQPGFSIVGAIVRMATPSQTGWTCVRDDDMIVLQSAPGRSYELLAVVKHS